MTYRLLPKYRLLSENAGVWRIIFVNKRIKCIAGTLILIGILSTLFFLLDKLTYFTDSSWEISCYDDKPWNVLQELDDDIVKINNAIWYVETRCVNPGGSARLTARQACSIESTARLNPQMAIYLLYPSPVFKLDMTEEFYMAAIFKHYPNILIRHLSVNQLFKDTPLEYKWNKEKAGLLKSWWPTVHMSDILRYTILWKYGGIYSDLDIISFRPFDEVMTDFVGAEQEDSIGSSILSLSKESVVTEYCMREIRDNFRGYSWAHNGPGVITRTMLDLCNSESIEEIFNKNCFGVTVLPSSAFYPVRWQQSDHYLTRDKHVSKIVMDRMNNSLGIHFWNSITWRTPIIKGSIQPLSLVMAEHCPIVYGTIPNDQDAI